MLNTKKKSIIFFNKDSFYIVNMKEDSYMIKVFKENGYFSCVIQYMYNNSFFYWLL